MFIDETQNSKVFEQKFKDLAIAVVEAAIVVIIINLFLK